MGAGFAFAVMPMVATFYARDDAVMVRRTTRMGLWISLGFAALALPLLWFSGPILRGLGQTEPLSQAAQDYLRIAALGLVPALMLMVLKSFLAALERTQIVLWVTLAAAVSNGLLNWALIFGNWGAPELGIRGAAIASVVTHCVSLMGVVAYVMWRLPEYTLFARFWRADSEMLARVFRLGWPISLTNLSEVGLFAASAIMMGWLGTLPLAAHGIALQLASATFMIHLGLSNVATVRVGNALGRDDADHMMRGAVTVIAASVVVSLATVVVFLGWPEPLISVFLDSADPDRALIIGIGVTLVAIAGLFQLVDGAQAVALGLLRGLQDTKVPLAIAAVSYWVVGISASYGLGFGLGWGGPGVWLGLCLGLGVAAVLLNWRFFGKRDLLLVGVTGK